MSTDGAIPGVHVISTCPASRDHPGVAYREQVAEVARWSEAEGCEGILVYADNSLVDPWLVAQLILQQTEAIRPLVAVQPVYMHPYSAAKMVASLAQLHGRAVDLNLIAGGYRNDLIALGDTTAHDDRYQRIREYGTIVQDLVRGGACSFGGEHYAVRNLRLAPPVAEDLAPRLMISGSSEAGMSVARALGALAVKYPEPPEREAPQHDEPVEVGFRVGIIARERAEEAWAIARERFPPSRVGELSRQAATRVSDSSWHHQLTALAGEPSNGDRPYWLAPFQSYGAFCPYLVGDHRTVAEELGRYLELGYSTVLLDIPREQADLRHAMHALRLAAASRR